MKLCTHVNFFFFIATDQAKRKSDLQNVVQEQAAVIESLKKEKKTVEESFASLKTDHERVTKENHVLRRAVQIQQDRQNQADAELKNAHKFKVDSEERIKKLEHMIMSLRYHLQAQQPPVGNDFLNNSHRPPDVF
uniref:Uncharacterized protein n=1 Tax=Amphora coffeiformis TaxID=265554 RepID=A0A7S3LG57_9STRA